MNRTRPSITGRLRNLRSGGTVAVALILGSGFGLAACSSSNASTYPSGFVTNFVQGCSTGSGAGTTSQCHCLATNIEKSYSWSQVEGWKNSKGNYVPPASAADKIASWNC